MFELIPLSKRNFHILCTARIGLVRLNHTDVCPMDSGRLSARFEDNRLLWHMEAQA